MEILDFVDSERMCDGCGALANAKKATLGGNVYLRWEDMFKFCKRTVEIDLVSPTTKTLYLDLCKKCLEGHENEGISELVMTEEGYQDNNLYAFIYSNKIAQQLIQMGYDIDRICLYSTREC
jgi:hypothetical protein